MDMARPRVAADRLRELIRLRRLGVSARQCARSLHMGHGTERRYRAALGQAGLLDGPPDQLPTLDAIAGAVRAALPPPPRPASTLDRWRADLEELLGKGFSARAALDRLRLEPRSGQAAFAGSYSAVKRAYARLRAERGVAADDVVIPVESAPGEAQVDFGYAGQLYDPVRGVLRRAWVFVMVLCRSRFQFVRLVFDQKAETWLALHEQAFQALGGVPRVIVPDNTGRAVLRAAFALDGPTELDRSYRELGERWGFVIDPAPPGAPRKRGKAEAAVKYLRGNPLAGRDGQALDVAQAALERWNREVANVRLHGATGRRPVDLFEAEERAALRPLPSEPVERAVWKQATVHPDCHLTCRGRLFSVPWPLVHERLWVRAAGEAVEVYHRERLVARHEDQGARRTTDEAHLPADRRDLRHRARAFWEVRAHRIGPETFALVRELLATDGVLSQLRQAQALVRHLERHPRWRAEAASQLARRAGERTYLAIKRVLAQALDVGALGDAWGPALPPTQEARA